MLPNKGCGVWTNKLWGLATDDAPTEGCVAVLADVRSNKPPGFATGNAVADVRSNKPPGFATGNAPTEGGGPTGLAVADAAPNKVDGGADGGADGCADGNLLFLSGIGCCPAPEARSNGR